MSRLNPMHNIKNSPVYQTLIASGVESHVAKNITRWKARYSPTIAPKKVNPAMMTYPVRNELTDEQKWSDAMKNGAVLIDGSIHWPLLDKDFYAGRECVLDTGKRFVMPGTREDLPYIVGEVIEIEPEDDSELN